MRKFLINLSIYFCLKCFGLSISPSSEAGVQLRQWFKTPGYGVSALRITFLLYNFKLIGHLSFLSFEPWPSKCYGPLLLGGNNLLSASLSVTSPCTKHCTREQLHGSIILL
jgi:hypothetical protein